MDAGGVGCTSQILEYLRCQLLFVIILFAAKPRKVGIMKNYNVSQNGFRCPFRVNSLMLALRAFFCWYWQHSLHLPKFCWKSDVYMMDKSKSGCGYVHTDAPASLSLSMLKFETSVSQMHDPALVSF